MGRRARPAPRAATPSRRRRRWRWTPPGRCRAKRGFPAASANLGIEKAVELAFHTYGPLAFTKLEPSGNDIVPDESTRLALVFTNPLAPPYRMTLSQAVSGFPQRCHALDDASPGLSCAAMLDPQTSYSERTIAVAKDARVPVLFDPTAAEPGDAVLRFSVAMAGENDAVEFKLPVLHPSPVRAERVASGVATGPTKIAVALPANAIASSAELVVSVDPDGLSGIENGLRDLIHYPYGCLEQTTSQVIPMIAVRDLADTLAIDGLTGPALERFVNAGITKIGRHQTAYGGFSLWPGGEPETYYTAYALWGLYMAQKAGYRVEGSRIDEGLEYLRSDGASPNQSRPHYNDVGNQGDQAFALYVRAVLGDKTTQDAATKLTEAAKLPIYGKAFLARALAVGLGAKDPAVAKLVAELAAVANAATKTDELIREPAERDLWAYMSSSARTSAAVLSALVELDPPRTPRSSPSCGR
jgi:hypothetical protein